MWYISCCGDQRGKREAHSTLIQSTVGTSTNEEQAEHGKYQVTDIIVYFVCSLGLMATSKHYFFCSAAFIFVQFLLCPVPCLQQADCSHSNPRLTQTSRDRQSSSNRPSNHCSNHKRSASYTNDSPYRCVRSFTVVTQHSGRRMVESGRSANDAQYITCAIESVAYHRLIRRNPSVERRQCDSVWSSRQATEYRTNDGQCPVLPRTSTSHRCRWSWRCCYCRRCIGRRSGGGSPTGSRDRWSLTRGELRNNIPRSSDSRLAANERMTPLLADDVAVDCISPSCSSSSSSIGVGQNEQARAPTGVRLHPLARRLTAVVAIAGRPRGHRYREAPSGRRGALVNYGAGDWRSFRTGLGEWILSVPERAGNGEVCHPCTWGMNGATTWRTEMELTFAVAISK
jgi:hypothetical protein